MSELQFYELYICTNIHTVSVLHSRIISGDVRMDVGGGGVIVWMDCGSDYVSWLCSSQHNQQVGQGQSMPFLKTLDSTEYKNRFFWSGCKIPCLVTKLPAGFCEDGERTGQHVHTAKRTTNRTSPQQPHTPRHKQRRHYSLYT